MAFTRRAALAGGASLPAFVAVDAAAQGSPAARWQFALAYPEGNFHTRNARAFSEAIEAATGGRVTIQMHPDGALLPLPQIKRGVQQGQVQLGEILLSADGHEDPFFEIDAIPQLARNHDEARRLSELTKPFIEARLARQGLTLLYMVAWPANGLYTNMPVETLDALRGTRLRTFSAMTNRFATLVGAVPTLVQASEVPQAFATGVVDAMVTSSTTGVDGSAWDHARFYTPIGFTFAKNAVVMSRRSFDAMSLIDQAAIRRLAAEAQTRGWALSQEANTANQNTLAARGVAMPAPTSALMEGLDRVSARMVTEWLTRAGEDGARVIAQFRAARS